MATRKGHTKRPSGRGNTKKNKAAEAERLSRREELRKRGEAKVHQPKGVAQLKFLKQVQKKIGAQRVNKRDGLDEKS